MEKRTISEVLFINLLLSASLTFISYIYTLFNFNDAVNLQAFLLGGQPFVIDYLTNSPVMKYLPMLPVFMAWFFIGALMYFLYYSLNNVYSFAYNRFLITSYKNAGRGVEFAIKIKPLERLIVHSVAIFGFITFILVYFFALLPLSSKISVLAEAYVTKFSTNQITIVAVPVATLAIYWITLVGIIQTIWHFIKKLEDYETFKAEHEAL